MLKHLTLRLLLLAAACLLFPLSARADPISISLNESDSGFVFSLTGTAVDHDFQYAQVLGSFWRIDFEIQEDDGVARDELSVVRFTVQHFPISGQPGPLLSLEPTTFIAYGSGVNFGVLTVTEAHFIDQFDRLVAVIRLQVTDNQITGYTIDVRGDHLIPEPATLILLGSGLIGLAIKKRRPNRFH